MAFSNQDPATVTLTLKEFKRLERAYNVFEDNLKYTKYVSKGSAGWNWDTVVVTNDEAVSQIAEDNKELIEKYKNYVPRPKGFFGKVKFLFS